MTLSPADLAACHTALRQAWGEIQELTEITEVCCKPALAKVNEQSREITRLREKLKKMLVRRGRG